MKIELCEDNGFMNDGKPTLIVLVVTRDDGKQLRIPYEADKTIQQLYIDVQKVTKLEVLNKYVQDGSIDLFKAIVKDVVETRISSESKDNVSKVNEIGREDIVKCVRLEKDMDGNVNEDISIGTEYRIIDIHKVNGQLHYYEVLDDSKGDKIRIPILPVEVELVRKFIPPPPRKQVFEISKKCECGEMNALDLNGDQYEGVCTNPNCGKTLIQKREIAHVR